MIKSMTGFGRATTEEGKDRIYTLEIKSVNHRYLDINVRMPKSMISLEEKIRKSVSEKLNRGKVDIFLNYKNYGQCNTVAKINTELADSYMECLKTLENRYKDIKNDVSVSLIARFQDVITTEEKEENLDTIWGEISPLLDKALHKIIEMRETEGEKLKEDILEKCSKIEVWVDEIDKKSPLVVEAYKTKLQERISDLLDNVEIDEQRIAMEVAIFADKAAIDEEVTRLKSHISQMRDTLSLEEPIGRKLDFLIQEMNRESNTIASKSTDLNITNLVINIKNIIEKIREQIQNIE
ncbi:YicC/YloC family endoribonuclease [Clostridium fallax]|uniref:TIGR00255 family protein n=1 Tax=Clostridium fallax TaxID=1533 RepID=A0A1M4X5S0_9CLOT|nr:YicC/YloC family endoribonuclease [Clostridium fallax]SHE88864.1 TIGR00255 family protein [Clostridium fallax]SQB07311.1 TIGR00255 family protein [Clostridium fallax]